MILHTSSMHVEDQSNPIKDKENISTITHIPKNGTRTHPCGEEELIRTNDLSHTKTILFYKKNLDGMYGRLVKTGWQHKNCDNHHSYL